MALRIQASDAQAHSHERPALSLPARADALLAGGDLEGYARLFAEASVIADVHRVYWARTRLIERGLAGAAALPERRLPTLLALIADCALRILESEPREPRLLNLAGVALYELWGLEGAHALFTAARRLDPELRDPQRNLAATAQRRRAIRGARRGAALHPALPALEGRARAVAQHARPAEGLKLSLCMIVRDEQEMLPRCLEAIAPAVDEIVIVDTGSVDGTIEIARSFGARVIERAWTGSFAEARNVSFDAASGDWIVYLDADEVLIAEDRDLLRSLTGRTWREAFYLAETNFTGRLDASSAVTHNALRVFRNRPEYRFEGRLHEQIAKTLPGFLPERLEVTPIRVEHYGYLGVVREARNKTSRNIELLRLQQQEGVDTAFLHYNLGSEYGAIDDYESARRELERAWEMLESDPERDSYQFVPALANRLVKALRGCGREQEAIARAEEALARFPDFTDLVLEQAAAYLSLERMEEAIARLERCIEMGDAPRAYTAVVGCGTYLPRIALGEALLARGEPERALQPLRECLRDHPRFLGSVMPCAKALLALGREPTRVAAEIERDLPGMPAAAHFLVGTALHEAGAWAPAETEFRATLERQPRSSSALVALGEALLAQRRYEEAAATAARVEAGDPFAAMACRTELFALLAAGDLDAAGAALTRAAATDLPRAELELFQAWQELLRSGAARRRLEPEALELLRRSLEALLRVQDFKAFEGLLGLLEQTDMSERARRELLAGVYFRRGYLASAAEEWMAVCAGEPDAEALTGLGQVAAARGMREEAVEFLQAALALEPAGEVARQVLGRLRHAV